MARFTGPQGPQTGGVTHAAIAPGRSRNGLAARYAIASSGSGNSLPVEHSAGGEAAACRNASTRAAGACGRAAKDVAAWVVGADRPGCPTQSADG
jgi:hypothetical protein